MYPCSMCRQWKPSWSLQIIMICITNQRRPHLGNTCKNTQQYCSNKGHDRTNYFLITYSLPFYLNVVICQWNKWSELGRESYYKPHFLRRCMKSILYIAKEKDLYSLSSGHFETDFGVITLLNSSQSRLVWIPNK